MKKRVLLILKVIRIWVENLEEFKYGLINSCVYKLRRFDFKIRRMKFI